MADADDAHRALVARVPAAARQTAAPDLMIALRIPVR
jgi:hypothetical protein